MALKQTKEIKGLTVTDAYIRVDRIFGGKREGWNSVVGLYANSEATEPLETFNASAPYDSEEINPYVLLYGAIKEMDGYTEAVDC